MIEHSVTVAWRAAGAAPGTRTSPSSNVFRTCAVHALVAQGAAIEENPPGIAGIGRVCRIHRGAAGNLRRYFPLRLPVALDAERAVFVYVDPGHETATALRSWGAAHRELWEALWDRGRGIEIVVVVRTTDERGRAETVLANWARDPHPSEFDHEIGREIDRIDRAIIKGDVRVLMEYGGLQAAMKRSVALTKRARRQAGRGLMQRTDTWRTVRLVGARFR